MRLHPEGGVPDLRGFLEGCLLGWLACVVLYTAFGYFLVSRHAVEIACAMRLFLCHGMTALLHPADPDLTGLTHRWGSALLLGLPLGSLAALAAATAFLVPWARGAVTCRTAAVGSLCVAAVLLALSFTPEMPVLSTVCGLLAPVFFLCPWGFVARRGRPHRRRRWRVLVFFGLCVFPAVAFLRLDTLRIRDAMLSSLPGRAIVRFYYEHALLAAHAVQRPVQQPQTVVALSEAVRIRGPLPHGTLWVRGRDPCSVLGGSVTLSGRSLACRAHHVREAAGPVNGARLLAEAGRTFPGNRRLRRSAGWFFVYVLPLLPVPAALWLALFLEDLFSKHRWGAAALLAGVLVLQAPLLSAAWRDRCGGLQPEPGAGPLPLGNPKERYRALLESPDRVSSADLKRLAEDDHPAIRLRALQALGGRRGSAVRRVLERALDDPEPIVRAHACRALGRQGAEESYRILARVPRADASWYVRNAAYQAAGRIRPEARVVRAGDCRAGGDRMPAGPQGRGGGSEASGRSAAPSSPSSTQEVEPGHPTGPDAALRPGRPSARKTQLRRREAKKTLGERRRCSVFDPEAYREYVEGSETQAYREYVEGSETRSEPCSQGISSRSRRPLRFSGSVPLGTLERVAVHLVLVRLDHPFHLRLLNLREGLPL